MATSIRLEPEIEKRLDFLATQTGRTKAFYLRELTTWRLTRWKEFAKGRRKSFHLPR